MDRIFQLCVNIKALAFDRNYTSDFLFVTFLGLATCGSILLCGARQQQQLTVSRQLHGPDDKQLIPCDVLYC